jgi:hypothetical protein
MMFVMTEAKQQRITTTVAVARWTRRHNSSELGEGGGDGSVSHGRCQDGSSRRRHEANGVTAMRFLMQLALSL